MNVEEVSFGVQTRTSNGETEVGSHSSSLPLLFSALKRVGYPFTTG